MYVPTYNIYRKSSKETCPGIRPTEDLKNNKAKIQKIGKIIVKPAFGPSEKE